MDPTFYPVVYGLKDDEDWEDEENWYKVNPSLGYTVDIERLRDAYREAKQNPADEVTFKWLRCNMWVSSTVAWIPDAIYMRGNESIEAASLEGRDCYAGLDLSSTGDITALVLIFPPRDENEKYVLLPYFWIPEETIPRRVKANSVPYDIWEKQGYIMSTEGNVIHYDFIEKFIMYLSEKYHILEIAVDRWNATQMIQNLEGEGFTIVPFGQGFSSMSAPTKEFYRLLMEGRIIHGGNPVLRWMAGNVVIDTDPAGNIKVRKSWKDAGSQLGAYTVLDNAKAMADKHEGYTVYDWNGKAVYGAEVTGGSGLAAEFSNADCPFMVNVSIDDLNIRKGAGTNTTKTGRYTGKGVFTIMEVKSGKGSDKGWGRLKSGAGWISLDYCQKI